MEQLNQQIFLLLNSGAGTTSPWLDHLAVFSAQWLVWVLLPALACGWFRGDLRYKKAIVNAVLAAIMALGAGALIGWLFPHPRPFALGLGRLLIDHVPDASLPSDHLTLWWSLALGLAFCPQTRRIGLLLTLAGLLPAWARIRAGVHFPLDMVAAFLLSWAVAGVLQRFGQPWVHRLNALAMQWQRSLLGRHA
ncbi:undecaprenyl-diphosphatase [Herbaspirillum sp. NPDC087042]|uniref:undecaprenyl-diphosphatase n=1 Tax=Herbaspirillum sp. NPDC087042 TaxID=3364004 RepID=UPI0038010395